MSECEESAVFDGAVSIRFAAVIARASGLALGIALSGAPALAPAFAAPQVLAAPTSAVDEVIVTAQKRPQRLADVPISMSVLSGEELGHLGISSTSDLAIVVPGLAIGQNSGSGDFPFISLRGVTMRDFADTNESPTAVTINEFYKANLAGLDGQFFDVARVDVLRGPQGTLYGRNATGGLIQVTAVAPSERFEGYASTLFGARSRVKLEGAVGGPLVPGILSARFSGLVHRYDGYTKNRFPGGKDGNALNASALRGQFALTPADDLKISLFAQYYVDDNEAGNMFAHRAVRQDPVTGLAVNNPGGSDVFGYRDPTPGDPRDTNSNRDIAFYVRQLTLIGRIEADLGAVKATSVTGYEATSKDATFDSDASPNPRGTEVHPDGVQWSQELRLSGSLERLDWLVGGYAFAYDVDGYQRRQTSAAGPRAPVFYDLRSRSWAAFASLDARLLDKLTLTLGARFTTEKKRYRLDNQDFGFVFSTETVGERARQKEAKPSFDVRLSYKPTAHWLAYASVARGHKAGTFNVGYTPLALDAIPVKPETLTSYEIGIRGSAFDERVLMSGAVFVYDYRDSQAFQFDGRTLSATTFNRDAAVQGGEFEFSAKPAPGVDVGAYVSYLDAVLKDVDLPGVGAIRGPTVDRKMPLAPKWMAGVRGRLRFPAPGGGTFALQGDVGYKSSQFFDAFNSLSHREEPYAVGNLRLSWTSSDRRIDVALFAENIGDTIYRTYAFDLSFLGQGTDVYAKPRWIGGEIRYRFGAL